VACAIFWWAAGWKIALGVFFALSAIISALSIKFTYKPSDVTVKCNCRCGRDDSESEAGSPTRI
jgi:hypothetical protein